MEMNHKIALILQELMKQNLVIDCIVDSDLELDKSYDFNSEEAIEIIQQFISENI